MSSLETNLDLYILLRQGEGGNLSNYNELYNTVKERLQVDLSEEDAKKVKKYLSNFCLNVKRKWQATNRTANIFMAKNSEWLESPIQWPILLNPGVTSEDDETMPAVLPSASTKVSTSTSTTIARKPFTDLSHKQKRRRSESLFEYSKEQLTFALITKIKSEGNGELAKLIDHIMSNPECAAEVSRSIFGKQENPVLEKDTALAVMTSTNLSKWQYNVIRQSINDHLQVGFIFPSYYDLLKAKLECYPPEEDITISDVITKIKLQSVLDLTARRLVKVLRNEDENACTLTLLSKWGCDGASSQSNYKQTFSRGESETSDSSVFMTSLVPLKLMDKEAILWENLNPSSTNLCRPIKFEFVKESEAVIKKEKMAMDNEIKTLIPTKVGNMIIQHDLVMTMIDGKTANVISDNASSQTCNLCLAKPTEMNDIDSIYKRDINEDLYKYGLSTLHMWIRCMECLLHISYNMDFKKWSARDENSKQAKTLKKQRVQTEFRNRMGLLIDIVKQGGGNTNDGNTARRFFRNFEESSEITGIDQDLIKRLFIILQTISSGQKINIEKFDTYCKETVKVYIRLYDWYYMPASLHKLLVHGPQICKYFSFIQIGKLSEEAAEARNKEFRQIREKHSRKCSRIRTNEDILHNLLISSDPYISHLRPKYVRSKIDLYPDTKDLIISETEEADLYDTSLENVPIFQDP